MGNGEWFTGPQGSRRRYRVSDPTAVPGGRGFVFPAERIDDGVAVGLKIIEEDDSFTVSRIEGCYSTLRRHPHPNLIEPLSLFLGPGLFNGDNDDPPDSDSDLLYLVYRWIPGETLRAAAPLDAPAAARLALDLAGAISHLHGVCWLIHRDIHPGNIVIGADGHATLIDIDAWVEVGDTRAAPASGVLGFLPPERATSRWDQRSDVWAVGMVMAYSLLGHPIGSASIQSVAAELADVLPRWVDAERVAALLGQLTAVEPDDRRTDLLVWAHELAALLTARPEPRHNPRVIAGVAALAAAGLMALASVVFGWWSDAPPDVSDPIGAADATPGPGGGEIDATLAPTLSDDGCTIPVGAAASDTALNHVDYIANWADELREAVPGACGVKYAEVQGQAVVQLVEVDGVEMVVLASEHAVVTMHPIQMSSYEQIAGRGSDLLVRLGGYPVEVLDPVPGVETLIRLSEGGLIIGRRADTQAFWMPTPVLAMWEAQGGIDGELGLPMTNPYTIAGGLKQDFERGFMTLPINSPQPWDSLTGDGLEVIPVGDVADPGSLPGEGILRQPNGTAWWFVNGMRHWIPDGGVWGCLGGHDAVVANDIDGPTLAAITLGPPAACDMAP